MRKYIYSFGENLQTLVRAGRAKNYAIQLGLYILLKNIVRDVPDSELAGYQISGKTKHHWIPDIWLFSNAGYLAGYPVSKILGIWP